MILVFIFFSILIIILLFIICLTISTIRIKFVNMTCNNMKKGNEGNIKGTIIFSIYLLNKIKIFYFRINQNKIRKIYNKIKLKDIDFKKIQTDFKMEDIKILKLLKIKISELNLFSEIGVESPIITSYIVVIISIIISNILPCLVDSNKLNNYDYKIIPIYKNRNLYNISLNCIIKVKIVHIINVIYIFIKKKRRSDVNERTTSNRRSYGYSNE